MIAGMRALRRLLPLALATAVGASLLIAPAAEARPRAEVAKGTVIDRTLFGMHVANAEYGNWPNVPIGSVRLWDNQTAWSTIEKAQGQFDWTYLDTSVATAKANGTNDILMVLAGTPAWATDDMAAGGLAGVLPGAAGMPRDFGWWDTWVRQVVTRYKGKITAYQPWNEANLVTFSTATPAEMADLTKRAHDIIKGIDPAATVVAPSTGTRLSGAFKRFYPAFLQELKARGWPVEVWTAHTYPASLGTPSDRSALARQWQAVLNAAGAPKLPMWDTENNFGLKGPGLANPDMDIEGEQAGDWVARAYLDALRLGITRVYWYRWENSFNDLWGIQMTPGSVGARSYQKLQDWIVGATYQGCRAKGAQVTCSFTRAGAPFQVVYSDNGRPQKFKVGTATQACDINGSCVPVRGKTHRTNGPVLLKR